MVPGERRVVNFPREETTTGEKRSKDRMEAWVARHLDAGFRTEELR
ncbi:hypothetical protein Hsar01_03972 [Haloferula sargassicola]|uniref:Uncharacterized protein n=1 Tax=Haloferula sargassicola TaxID=490096 RepID=A0ABP9UWF6_9BACT